MRLWVLSDLHADRGVGDIATHAPDFDVFVCAGDTLTGDIAGSIEMTAAIARGKPAVFVAGNHEWMSAADPEEVLDEAHAVARREGVHFLECDYVEIGGIRFAGATLWTPLDFRYRPSAKSLQASRADVVVTHFGPPANDLRWILRPGRLWIFGHHHGFEDSDIDGRRLIRNALGYGAAEDLIDSEPSRFDFVVEVGP
jgi:predicted phosphodiesterase